MDETWIEHRRSDDGERVGWIQPLGEGFVAIDLLGRPLTEAVDWLSAEETLDAIGLGYLADPHELRLEDGSWLQVRIAEVSPSGIRFNRDDWSDITASQHDYSLPFPVPRERLRIPPR